MAYKSIFLLKLAYIKNKYGQEAKEYFSKHPICENCEEKRLACLALHHVNGKKEKVFKTLCFNCHMLHHATRSKDSTYDDYLKRVEKQNILKEEIKNRDLKVVNFLKQGLSLREIATKVNISHVAVYYISRKYNIRSKHVNQFKSKGRSW